MRGGDIIKTIDFVQRQTARKTLLLGLIDGMVGMLLLSATLLMVGGIMWMLH